MAAPLGPHAGVPRGRPGGLVRPRHRPPQDREEPAARSWIGSDDPLPTVCHGSSNRYRRTRSGYDSRCAGAAADHHVVRRARHDRSARPLHAVRPEAGRRASRSACSGTSRTPSSTPSPTGWPTSGCWPGPWRTAGRRRKTYSLTGPGLDALREWLAAPTAEHFQLRDIAELKLFFHEIGEPEHVAAWPPSRSPSTAGASRCTTTSSAARRRLAHPGAGSGAGARGPAILDRAGRERPPPAARARRGPGMNRPARRLESAWRR